MAFCSFVPPSHQATKTHTQLHVIFHILFTTMFRKEMYRLFENLFEMNASKSSRRLDPCLVLSTTFTRRKELEKATFFHRFHLSRMVLVCPQCVKNKSGVSLILCHFSSSVFLIIILFPPYFGAKRETSTSHFYGYTISKKRRCFLFVLVSWHTCLHAHLSDQSLSARIVSMKSKNRTTSAGGSGFCGYRRMSNDSNVSFISSHFVHCKHPKDARWRAISI
jgi:hypothetical protein